jgi:LemA protein
VSAQTLDQKVAAETALTSALGRLMVVVERYPELRASENFRDLQQQLEGTENRISIERRRYNQAVRDLNTYVRSFFGRMFTRWAGVGSAEYFEVADSAREVPQVDFGTRPPAPPATGTAPPATGPGGRP